MSKNEVSYLAGAEQAIPLERLRPFANHPFQVRHDLEMRELMDSIGESGIITPILVRPKENGLYEVISGHRRWEACKELGVQQIPAKVLYMHITDWLFAEELCGSLQFSRFLNRDGQQLFQVRDGQRVMENYADGTRQLHTVRNIDCTHIYVGHYGCHIQQYADANFKSGCYVTPEHPQPGDNLDKLQIYQITADTDYRFMRYSYARERIRAEDYSSVYLANLPRDYDLEKCFREFNVPARPCSRRMHSLSVSDIVVLEHGGKEQALYVDSVGFQDVSHLLPELHELAEQRQKEQVQEEPER